MIDYIGTNKKKVLGKNETISVIIPTFNRQETLLRAINSVLKQTYPVHEIIVCDDGSNDNSRSIIMALNNPLIRWIDCGRNGMPSIPRNLGIKASTGDWIAFLDSDDEWLSNKIELQVSFLKKSNGIAVSCNAFRIINKENKGVYLNFRKKLISFQDFLRTNNVICSSVLVKKSLLEDMSFFPEEAEYTSIEDYLLWLRLSTKIDFLYINQPLLKYYDDPKSSIRIFFEDVKEIQRAAFKNFIKWIEENEILLKIEYKRQLIAAIDEVFIENKPSFFNRLKQRVKKIIILVKL